MAPQAVLLTSVSAGAAPLDVFFSGSVSLDPDGTIVSFDWDFGDGDTASGEELNHTYTDEGSYTATLTVTDNGGATAVDTEQIEVTANLSSVTLVAESGADSGTCGVVAEPCGTVAHGISRASTDGNTEVFVAVGAYDSFRVSDGINVRGGLAADFQSVTGTSSVDGSFDGTAGVSSAITAENIATATTVSSFVANGADESANARPALGVFVGGTGSGLTLADLTIAGGASGTSATGLLVDGHQQSHSTHQPQQVVQRWVLAVAPTASVPSMAQL